MNMQALIAFNAANEIADDIYAHQQQGGGDSIAWAVFEEYSAQVQRFEDLTGENFGAKRQEYLELTQ